VGYRYLAISPNGEQVRGAIEVPDEATAERALWDADYRVVSLRRERKLPAVEQLLPSLFAVKKRDLVTFSRQLATLLESGVPVMRSLELLEAQASARPLARALRAIAREIRGGSTFADAIRQHPAIFPPVYARMVELGERTGRIEAMLHQLARYLEREDAIVKRVRGAMAYPAFIIVLAVVVVAVLMTTALPALTQMFKEFDADLPVTTRLLIWLTDFTGAYRTQLLGVLVLTLLAGAWFFGQPFGKRLLHSLVLRVPVLRGITIDANAARFSRTLAIMLRAGLPLTEVMDMLVRTTDNSVLRARVEGVRRRLIDGEGLSQPMADAACFPPMLVQMVAVGEETGTLDANLEITADFYTREVDARVDALTGMMTPALTLVIGVVVGFIALSLIMPMYQLIGHINDAGATQVPPP